MEKAFVLRYRLTQADIAAGIRAFLFRQRWVRLSAFFAATWLLAPLAAMLMGFQFLAGQSFWVFAFPGLALFAFAVLFFVSPHQAWRQMPPSMRDVEHVWEFTEEGIRHGSEHDDSRTDWHVWASFVETKDQFIVSPSPQTFVVLPKRGFASVGCVEAFRDLLTRKLSARA